MSIFEYRSVVDSLLPDLQKGHSLPQEIKCYTLPYGFLGFLSHILTYYTIFWLWKGRNPLLPCFSQSSGLCGVIFAFISLVGTFSMAVYTIVHCRNSWQLVVIAVWKMGMSMWNGLTGLHVALAAYQDDTDDLNASLWTIFYVPFMIAGMVGLMSLVKNDWDDESVEKLTIAFYSVIGFFVVCTLYRRLHHKDDSMGEAGSRAVVVGISLFCVMAALYSDWALGILSHNLLGVPSPEIMALWWTYFIVERLTMLIF